MTSQAFPAGRDPHRLLTDLRGLTRRVRIVQRVTWLPLLVLALVTFGAIPAYLFGDPHVSNCQPIDGAQVCEAWFPVAEFYWLAALVLGYVVIAAGYVRVARARGVDARVVPYVVTGVTLLVVIAVAVGAGAADWIFDGRTLRPPPAFAQVLFRLLGPAGAIGVALLVLAWLERHVALLLFTLLYLAVVLVPIDFGWEARSQWQFVPMLVIGGGVLLLGSAGFALAQRRQRSR